MRYRHVGVLGWVILSMACAEAGNVCQGEQCGDTTETSGETSETGDAGDDASDEVGDAGADDSTDDGTDTTDQTNAEPLSDDHIAVTLNGNPGEHYLPTAMPDLEDNMWHQMEIRVVGKQVSVSMDDVEIMNGGVPGLTFKGGYIGFTGSTGYYTNYHRFDDLEVEEACRF